MEKILIVEDDAAIAGIEKDDLEIGGYLAEIAPDGMTGLKRGLGGGFDLILLDVMLPGMDGFSVCRKLRETLDIPILMVTARREDIDKIRGLGLGADDYIEKPFSPGVLVARVKANLAQYKRLSQTKKAPSEIVLGGIRLHTGTRRVFVDEREVWQSVKDADTAYHCGSKHGYRHKFCRNGNSLGIELCSRKDKSGRYYFKPETVERAPALARGLGVRVKDLLER